MIWLWRILGSFTFVMGAIGLVLPVWPTAVFWLVSALAFAKSNPAWAEWIYERPGVGEPIRIYLETGCMTRASKLASYFGLLLATIMVIVLLWGRWYIVSAALSFIALGTLFIVSRRTHRDSPPAGDDNFKEQ